MRPHEIPYKYDQFSPAPLKHSQMDNKITEIKYVKTKSRTNEFTNNLIL